MPPFLHDVLDPELHAGVEPDFDEFDDDADDLEPEVDRLSGLASAAILAAASAASWGLVIAAGEAALALFHAH
jgi:hypothetical protein